MIKVKKGEKIYIPKFGLSAIVNYVDEGGFIVELENGKPLTILYNYAYKPDEIKYEKFIKPKYKVGEKIMPWFASSGKKDVAEIVKVALNKKTKSYVYLAFTLDCGYPIVEREEDVILYKKEKIVELTVDEISKKLGYKVKVKC